MWILTETAYNLHKRELSSVPVQLDRLHANAVGVASKINPSVHEDDTGVTEERSAHSD